jgi:hypothetical protein
MIATMRQPAIDHAVFSKNSLIAIACAALGVAIFAVSQQRNSGTAEQRNSGTAEQRNSGTAEQRNSGTAEQ